MNNYQLLLQKLDDFIRKYYLNKLLRGSLLFVAVLLGTYLFISLFEYQLYLSSLVRKAILLVFSSTILVAFYFWMIQPSIQYFKLGNQITHEQAATIIGKYFSDVKDKLLNILHLNQQSHNTYNKELIEASISQKSESIKLVPFSNAINLQENKKYLKLALPPFLLLLLILFIAPNVLKESSTRLLNPNTIFAKIGPLLN